MCVGGIGTCGLFALASQGKVVLVVMSFMRSVTVTVVKVVDVSVVLDRGVATVWAVLVLVLLGLEVALASDPTAEGAV